MKTNVGLLELAAWLELQMNVSLAKIYEIHLAEAQANLATLVSEFGQTALSGENASEKAEHPVARNVDVDRFFSDGEDAQVALAGRRAGGSGRGGGPTREAAAVGTEKGHFRGKSSGC
jgi:hypothetical protein